MTFDSLRLCDLSLAKSRLSLIRHYLSPAIFIFLYIEMLQFHGRRALLAQAMNEIGNIMLHIGNKRYDFDTMEHHGGEIICSA